uniref:Uncharacterized protein n=1 Tax=Toxoplasma gondii (strain ATCC 50861 / VEG) TaxID=432359 RepID=A0A0F7UYY9_TOXGV|nr:TPA: hypothetical protein BN1205_045720 [Toxoplasma gondii VEG]
MGKPVRPTSQSAVVRLPSKAIFGFFAFRQKPSLAARPLSTKSEVPRERRPASASGVTPSTIKLTPRGEQKTPRVADLRELFEGVGEVQKKPSSGGVSTLASAPSLPSVSPSKSSQGAGSVQARISGRLSPIPEGGLSE